MNLGEPGRARSLEGLLNPRAIFSMVRWPSHPSRVRQNLKELCNDPPLPVFLSNVLLPEKGLPPHSFHLYVLVVARHGRSSLAAVARCAVPGSTRRRYQSCSARAARPSCAELYTFTNPPSRRETALPTNRLSKSWEGRCRGSKRVTMNHPALAVYS